jgi:hypothetical protein
LEFKLTLRYPVSNDVGKVSNDAEYLTQKIEIKPTKDLRSFFVKKEGGDSSPSLSPSKQIQGKQDIRNFFKVEPKKEPTKTGSPTKRSLAKMLAEELPSEPEEPSQPQRKKIKLEVTNDKR